MAYNKDKNITVMSVNLEHLVKARIALNETGAEHERRLRDLEVRVGRRTTGDN